MEQEVVSTRIANPAQAAEDLARQLKKPRSAYQAVIFMAAITYDFEELSKAIKEKFPESEVIGTSTAGEIDKNGFSNNSVVLCTMSDARTKVKGVLIENGSKYPMANKDDIEKALRYAGISCGDSSSHKSAFALAFINGVFNAEETILTTFYSIIIWERISMLGNMVFGKRKVSEWKRGEVFAFAKFMYSNLKMDMLMLDCHITHRSEKKITYEI